MVNKQLKMEMEQIGTKTYAIKGPTNIGLFKTGENTVGIIDTGATGYGEIIDQMLMEKGWTPEYIINTHNHVDHTGGNKYLMNKYNIPAYIAEKELALVHYSELEAAYMNGGYPAGKLRYIFEHPGKIGFRPIEEAQLDGIRHIELAGHSPAMIGVMTEDGIWFLGDAYLSLGYLRKNKFCYIYRIDEFLESLEKLKSLEGSLFVPSHGSFNESLDNIIDANINNAYELISIVMDICLEAKGIDNILKEMYERVNMKEGAGYYAMLSSTVKSILSYLLDNDKLEDLFIDNTMKWKVKTRR